MTMGLVNAAKQLESYGRGPDTSLAHISPDESAMLDYMQGGRRMNPVTGLPEYSMFGKILKAVARIGATTAGFMYGGPLGAAAANAAITKLTGGSWKQALTSGAISGVTAGLGNYASGVRGLGNIATTTGNSLAAGAGAAGSSTAGAGLSTGAIPGIATPVGGFAATAPLSTGAIPGIATPVSGFAATAPSTVSVSPGFMSGLQTPSSAVPSSFMSSAPSAITPSAVGSAGISSGLGSGVSSSLPGVTTGVAASAPSGWASSLAPIIGENTANYLGTTPGTTMALQSGLSPFMEKKKEKDSEFEKLPEFDPSNVSSWLKPAYGAEAKARRLQMVPIKNYQNFTPEEYPGLMGINQQMYADGGDVAPAGMGLPQSAAIPQLMSAAQWGYLNARTGGRINGPGDGKSDDIPALLSNGEHVIDAATVSDLGNGDNDTGQKRLEQIKHKIRSSAGRKNPRKASPKQKGLGSLLNSARA